MSYVASRKAIAARAQAGTLSALETKKMAEKDLSKFKDQDAQKAKSELEGTKQALTNAQREADEQRRKAEEALQKIAGMEAKQSDKGFVLTLSGSVLFATGKSVLLPQAQQRLGEVVKALKEDKRHITVVGHTDSQGADDMNMKLSQARADAVRNYLVQQGVESSRVARRAWARPSPSPTTRRPRAAPTTAAWRSSSRTTAVTPELGRRGLDGPGAREDAWHHALTHPGGARPPRPPPRSRPEDPRPPAPPGGHAPRSGARPLSGPSRPGRATLRGVRRSSALAVALACARPPGPSRRAPASRRPPLGPRPRRTVDDGGGRGDAAGDGGVPVLDGGGSGDASGDAALPNRCPSARGPAMPGWRPRGRGYHRRHRSDGRSTAPSSPPRTSLRASPRARGTRPTSLAHGLLRGRLRRAPGRRARDVVDWCDAWTYCAWAGKRLCGRVWSARAGTSDGARDPATVQWFAACTGGDANRTYAYGAPYDPKRCNGSDYEAGAPLPVTSLPACVGAAPGLYGMSGNAAELGDACDPAADGRPESDRCALHGGGFVHGEENVRCATYYLGPRSGRFADLGFRCCAD